ncbi:unnamed protein product [Lota lota]
MYRSKRHDRNGRNQEEMSDLLEHLDVQRRTRPLEIPVLVGSDDASAAPTHRSFRWRLTADVSEHGGLQHGGGSV